LPFPIHILARPEAGRAIAAAAARVGYRSLLYADAGEFLAGADLARGCVLLELVLERIGALCVQEELVRRGADLPVIGFGTGADLEAAVRAMKLGALDFLECPFDDAALAAVLARAHDASLRGSRRRRARRIAAARLERLSPRERQILRGLAGGLSNKAIARILGLSPRTVEMHRASMMADLGISSLPEAVRLAVDADLTPLTEAGQEDAGELAPAAPPAATLAKELEAPLNAISDFARGLRERLEGTGLSADRHIGDALDGVERSASRAVEIAERIRREALGDR
jgi:FixJ family two-component response regulator